MWPFNALMRKLRTVREAWRDIRELSYPYSPADVTWPDLERHRENHGPVTTVPSAEPTDADCGHCDLCQRPVWYHVVYTSAGYVVNCLLCESCMWSMLQMSPHIHTFRLTHAREQWLRRTYPERYIGE